MNTFATFAEYAIHVDPVSEEYGEGFEALFPKLGRGVVGYGSTQSEAIEDLLDAAPGFLEALIETGQELPAPTPPREWDEFSGKFNVRVTKLLHAQLVRLAEAQSVSLNSLVQTILSSGATALATGNEFGVVDASPKDEPTKSPHRRRAAKRELDNTVHAKKDASPVA